MIPSQQGPGPEVPAPRSAPPPEQPIGIGERLAAARAVAGLSHDDVARTTRIPVARLVEFENDDYSGCGATVFARGRLTTIARAVGVSPEPLLAAFDARHGTAGQAAEAGVDAELDEPGSYWLLVLLALVTALLVYPVALLVVAVLG